MLRLFTKIEFTDFDLFIPFFCHKCAFCCSTYIPSISHVNLEIIFHHLNLEEREWFASYAACYRKKLTGHPEPCIFLKEKKCMIYFHPLRPDVCRLYPFSFDKPQIRGCPGYDEHQKIIRLAIGDRAYSDMYDSSFCPERPVRPIPDRAWCSILREMTLAAIPDSILQELKEMNNMPP